MARTTFTGPLVIGRAATSTSEGVNGEIIIQNSDGSTSSVGGITWEVITASKSASAATGLFTPGVGDTIQLKNITTNSNGFAFNEFVFSSDAGGIEGVVSGASGVGGTDYSKGTPIPRGFGTTSGQYIYSGSTYGWVRV